MNSINQQQEENNHKDISGSDAIKKIKELAEKAGTCFFCTSLQNPGPFQVRPMSLQKADENGNLWFLAAMDSHLVMQVKENAEVQLLFQGSAHSDLLNITGTASVSQDKAMIKELWEPLVKTWFTGGEDDPRIAVIQVKIKEGYYWDNKHGNAVAFIKMAIGAASGKTMDDSIEGKVVV